MTVGSELLSVVKKIFLVSDEHTRLSAEVKADSHPVGEHYVRLAVFENTLTLTRRSSKLILHGN